MELDAIAEVAQIKEQTVFSKVTIERDFDHMNDFRAFMDCFRDDILRIQTPPGQAVLLEIFSMRQGKPVEDYLFYHPSKDLRHLETQFLTLHPLHEI